MRQIGSFLMRDHRSLILLTARDLTENSLLMAADFLDIQALVYKPTGSWIGMNENGVRLGKEPLEMVDGVWFLEEDLNLGEKHKNVQLSPDLLCFEFIK